MMNVSFYETQALTSYLVLYEYVTPFSWLTQYIVTEMLGVGI